MKTYYQWSVPIRCFSVFCLPCLILFETCCWHMIQKKHRSTSRSRSVCLPLFEAEHTAVLAGVSAVVARHCVYNSILIYLSLSISRWSITTEFKWNVNLPVLYNFTWGTMAMCCVVWFACKPVGDHIHNSSGDSALKIGDLSECTNLNFLFSTHSLWYHAEIYAVHIQQQYCMHWKMHHRGQVFMEKPQSSYTKVLVQIKWLWVHRPQSPCTRGLYLDCYLDSTVVQHENSERMKNKQNDCTTLRAPAKHFAFRNTKMLLKKWRSVDNS